MTKPTDMAFTYIKTERDMRANGKTISNMDSEKRFGPTTANTKATTQKAKNMVRVFISGKMAQCTMVIGTRTGLKDMVNTNGRMAVSTLENGKIIICMVKVFTLGLMVGDMKGSMKWTRSTVLVYINGLITEYMKETGSMASNMAEASTFSRTATSK